MLEIEIKTHTPAFGETEASENAELKRLLQLAAQEIGSGRSDVELRDGNGTVVGHARRYR